MSSFKINFSHLLLFHFIFIFIHLLSSCNAQDLKACKFDAIYQFGDSMNDVGNARMEFNNSNAMFRPPWGRTIGKPTGRPSDGYLMCDYFAQAAGLPLTEPFENPNSTLTHGANFAVAGVTVLPTDLLYKKMNFTNKVSNKTLTVQLDKFKSLLTKICPDKKDCPEKLKSALFLVGTIGTNDYNVAFFTNRTIDEAKNLVVADSIRIISEVIQELINLGAKRLVVPGSFQMGCTPSYLTLFESNKSSTFDNHGCLKDYNDFFEYHNIQLKAAIDKLQKENPNVQIAYGDIYHALEWIYNNLQQLGFKTITQSCCGQGGKYNNSNERGKGCGNPSTPVCENPLDHVYWDGGHFSHQTNKYLAEYMIKDFLPKLKCNV